MTVILEYETAAMRAIEHGATSGLNVANNIIGIKRYDWQKLIGRKVNVDNGYTIDGFFVYSYLTKEVPE